MMQRRVFNNFSSSLLKKVTLSRSQPSQLQQQLSLISSSHHLFSTNATKTTSNQQQSNQKKTVLEKTTTNIAPTTTETTTTTTTTAPVIVNPPLTIARHPINLLVNPKPVYGTSSSSSTSTSSSVVKDMDKPQIFAVISWKGTQFKLTKDDVFVSPKVQEDDLPEGQKLDIGTVFDINTVS